MREEHELEDISAGQLTGTFMQLINDNKLISDMKLNKYTLLRLAHKMIGKIIENLPNHILESNEFFLEDVFGKEEE